MRTVQLQTYARLFPGKSASSKAAGQCFQAAGHDVSP